MSGRLAPQSGAPLLTAVRNSIVNSIRKPAVKDPPYGERLGPRIDRIGFEPEASTASSMKPRSDGATMLRQTLMDRVQGPLAGSIGLRPATAADEPFLYRVYASTREDELRLVDWDDDQKAAFLTMQFSAQRSSYRQQFPGQDTT